MRKIDSAVVVAKSQRPTVSMRSSSWTTDQSLSSWSWWTDTTNLSWFVRRRGNTKFYGEVRMCAILQSIMFQPFQYLTLYGHPALDVYRYILIRTTHHDKIFRISVVIKSFRMDGQTNNRDTSWSLSLRVLNVIHSYDEYSEVCFILSGLAWQDGDTFTRR